MKVWIVTALLLMSFAHPSRADTEIVMLTGAAALAQVLIPIPSCGRSL